MMENYGQVLDLTAEAQDSAGLSAQRMELYTASLAGKTAQLQASMEKLYSTMLDSAFMKGIAELATLIINVTSALGGWTVILPAIIMALVTFKSTWLVSTAAVSLGTKIFSVLPIVLQQLVFNLGLSDAALTALATGGIMLLVMALPVLYNWLNDNVEAFHTFFESTTDISKGIVELSDKISALTSEWNKLRQQATITQAEKDRMAFLANQITAEEALLAIEKQRLYQKVTQYTPNQGALGGALSVDSAKTESLYYKNKPIDSALSGMEDPKKKKAYLEYYEFLKDASKYVTLLAKETRYLADMDGYLASQSLVFVQNAEQQQGYLAKLSNTMTQFRNGLTGVVDLYKEFSANGEISIGTVLGLIESGSDLVDLLYIENGVYKLNAQAAADYYNTKRTMTVNGLKLTRAEIFAQIQLTNKIIESTNAILQKAVVGEFVTFNSRTNARVAALNAAEAQLVNLNAALANYDRMVSVIPPTLAAYVTTTSQRVAIAERAAADALKATEDAIQAANDALQRQITLLERQKDAATDAIGSQITLLQRQLDMLKTQNKETQNQIDLQLALDELGRARLQRNTRVYTSTGWEWRSDAGAISSAEKNVTDIQKSMAEDAIQKKIDALTITKEDTAASYDARIKNLRGYSSGGMVDFTGAAMLHGSKGQEEYVSNPTETKVLYNMFQKMGGSPTSKFGGMSGGQSINLYGDLNVSAPNGATLDSILESAASMIKAGR